MKRQFNPAELELMDRPQPVSAELESDLENIRELNRWFGSYALISMFLVVGSSRARACALSILPPARAIFHG